jgi:hypothetical protein
MSKYQRVYTEFWRETRAWEGDERVLALYLLTCEHRRMEGLFPLPIAYAAHDISWPTERVEKALAGLTGRGWAVHDGEWVLIVNALRYDQPNRGNQTKSAARAVDGASTASPLYHLFYAAARRFCEDFAEHLRAPTEGAPETQATPSGVSTPSYSSSYSYSSSNSSSAGNADAPEGATAAPDQPMGEMASPMHVAATTWREVVEPILAAVTDWQAALMNGAGAAVCDLIAVDPDAPWDRIATAAAEARRTGTMGRATPHGAMRAVVESWRRGSLPAEVAGVQLDPKRAADAQAYDDAARAKAAAFIDRPADDDDLAEMGL